MRPHAARPDPAKTLATPAVATCAVLGADTPSRAALRCFGLDSEAARRSMVERLREQGLHDERVLAALLRVPRHHFVEPALAAQAYQDNALPIGFGQTISKPSSVALALSAALQARGKPTLGKVLDIGTGCGYAAAVTAQLADEVYSIERVRALHERARNNLRALRIPNLRLLFGDGMAGCPQGAPFDVILSAAAALDAPKAWLDQLTPTGVLIAPLGEPQQLVLLRKRGAAPPLRQVIEAARYVPLKSGVV